MIRSSSLHQPDNGLNANNDQTEGSKGKELSSLHKLSCFGAVVVYPRAEM